MLTRPIFVRVARRPSEPEAAAPKRPRRRTQAEQRPLDVSLHPLALLVNGAMRF